MAQPPYPPYPQQAYRQQQPPPPPPGAPLHMLPPPRPFPPRATSNSEDTVLMVWSVVFAVAGCAALAQAVHWGDRALNRNLNQEEFLASAAATFFLFLFSTLVGIRYFVKIGVRKRLLSLGTAVPGTVLHTTEIRRKTRGNVHLGTRYVVRVAFDNREATIFDLHWRPDAQTPVFLDGKWAGIFVQGLKPEVGLGKIRPRKP